MAMINAKRLTYRRVPSRELRERGGTASSSSSEWRLVRRVTVTFRRLGRERPSASELDGDVILGEV